MQINMNSLREERNEFGRLTSSMVSVGRGFSSVRRSIDSDVRGRLDIENCLNEVNEGLNYFERVLRNVSRYMNEVDRLYSDAERRLALFVARINLRAAVDRSCSSVAEVALEAIYRGFECRDNAVQAIEQSGFFGDAATVSANFTYIREPLYARNNAREVKVAKPGSTKASIQEKVLSWDEVLTYAAYIDSEQVEKVRKMLEDPNLPFEAKKSMIDDLRIKAMEMWSILENSSIPSGIKDNIKMQSYNKNADQNTKSEGTGNAGSKSGYRTIEEFKKQYGDVIEQKAKGLGVDPNALAAVMFVESSGSGFYSNGDMKIRFEVHIFLGYNIAGSSKYFRVNNGVHQFRETETGEWKNLHVSSTKGDTQYAALAVATKLNKDAAYKSISMGLGQQMGFNHKACGYSSAEEMFKDYSKGEDRQIDSMFNFIKNYNSNMLTALKKKNYENFVRYYNGASIGSKDNKNYSSKMGNYEDQYKAIK